LRVALVGLGAAAFRGHLPALARLESEQAVTLVGVADLDRDRRAAIAAEQPETPVFDSVETMLASVRSDVLVVAAEPGAHARLAVLGAQHGQHLLCEKPLAITRVDHDLIAASFVGRSDLGLIAVHQYRYSPTWVSLSRWVRRVNRLRIPFRLVVHVERVGTDRHAASTWREDFERSGGMLADHGTHFLALAYTISETLEVLCVSRTDQNGRRERAGAKVHLGSGTLELHVSAAALERHTRVDVQAGGIALRWHDEALLLKARTRTLHRWGADALSDRAQVDALYVPLYRDLVANFRDASWRAHRTAEALTVGNVLIELLEKATS
jgi:predicted dehydrogenase